MEKNEILIKELQAENEVLKRHLKKYTDKNNYIAFLEQENKSLREELEKITYSRSYKIIQKVKKFINI